MTQTIRLWKHRLMRGGQRSYIPGVGAVRLLRVECVELDELNDADALPGGLPDADALRGELRQIDGEKLAAGYQAFRGVFELEERSQSIRVSFDSPSLPTEG